MSEAGAVELEGGEAGGRVMWLLTAGCAYAVGSGDFEDEVVEELEGAGVVEDEDEEEEVEEAVEDVVEELACAWPPPPWGVGAGVDVVDVVVGVMFSNVSMDVTLVPMD